MLLLISLLGLLAVTTRNGCVVILYIVALVVMILIEVYLIYYVFSEKSAFDSYNLWKHLPFTRMEQLQRTFDCCGFNSSIPKLANSSCASEMFCHEKIHDTYIRYLDISAIVEIVFVSLQVLTLLAMSFLAGRKPINEDTRAREEASFNKRSKHQDRSVY